MSNHKKILIVDDNPDNILYMKEILEDFRVEKAFSGEEGLTMASEILPDIILLDIMMPGIDGYEVCRRIRANPTLQYTKVILMSAKAMTSERVKGFEAGADDYLSKPFEDDELLAKVKVFLRLQYVEVSDMLKNDLLSRLCYVNDSDGPLRSIFSPLYTLIETEDMDQRDEEKTVETILRETKSLLEILHHIIELCKMKSKKSETIVEASNLAKIIQEFLGNIESSGHEMEITLFPTNQGKARPRK